METGMLWFDNDKKSTLEKKVARAAAYYKNKYGQMPNLCFVHPNLLPPERQEVKAGRVEVRGSETMLPNYFWIGVNHDHSH